MGQRIGFLGPFGTFTEQALRRLDHLAGAEHVPHRTVPDVLDAVQSGDLDFGLVPIENSIEGMVNFTQDALAFDHDLLIQHEVVIDIEHCLLVRAGTDLESIREIRSIPVATAQCHRYLRETFPDIEVAAANSTADAARTVAESDGGHIAAVAPRVAAEVYDLEVAAADIADHDGNQTRFVLVARTGVPAPTGHDRTALVIHQRSDEPGSLISILQEFAARRINLSNLLSRPIKDGGLGDYCFIIYADGHVSDQLLADAMRSLHAKQGQVKFLGSYPAAGEGADEVRVESGGRWAEADRWLADLRGQIH
ncbi:MAG: prephenate dehydratase [Actinomycetota bacterium]